MVCSGKVFISIPINYYRFTNQYFDVMLCTIKLNFKIYFNFRCSNSWLLWMNFISVLYCDIIVMGLILLCYLSLWWFILNEYVRISSEMFFFVLDTSHSQLSVHSYFLLQSCLLCWVSLFWYSSRVIGWHTHGDSWYLELFWNPLLLGTLHNTISIYMGNLPFCKCSLSLSFHRLPNSAVLLDTRLY